jgi:methylated-DNA-[protein]-cysteine S-methyltransferase
MNAARHSYHIFETAHGFCAIAWNEVGITRFQLPSQHAETTERNLLRRTPGAASGTPTPEVIEIIAAVHRYYAGEAIDFSHIPIDLGELGELSQRIYSALRHVPWGNTTTYGGLAKELGIEDWEGARDVGQAMGKNPVPLIIPCHRVLAAGGKPGGFSAPGGTETKLRMLELEGVRVGSEPPAQGSLGL